MPREISASQARKSLYRIIDAISSLEEEPVVLTTRRGRVAVVPVSFLEDEGVSLSAMAYDRETFMDRIIEKLMGGFREFYKSRLAIKELTARRKLKKTVPAALASQKWVDHWEQEAQRLLVEELEDVLKHKLKIKGREKAANAALLAFLETNHKDRVSAATRIVGKDYKLPEVIASIDEEDVRAALALVEEAFTEAGLRMAKPDLEPYLY